MRVLGVDVGGSGIKGALVNTETGKLITERLRFSTPQPATPKAIVKVIQKIVLEFKWKGRIGVGFPAVIKGNRVHTASNISNSWIGTDAVKLITKATGRPCIVINDADAAVLAEVNYGSKRLKKGTVLFLTVGTGIGTAILTNGHLLPNTEFGDLYLKKVGNAEGYCADSARKRYRLTWKEWAGRFNKYLKQVYFLTRPDLILIGGGASKKSDRYREYLDIKTPIRYASLKNEAGIIGAAWAAAQKRSFKNR